MINGGSEVGVSCMDFFKKLVSGGIYLGLKSMFLNQNLHIIDVPYANSQIAVKCLLNMSGRRIFQFHSLD